MSSIRARARRVIFGSVAAVVVLALASGPVLAETEKGHHGLVGDHKANDLTNNRVVCHYNGVSSRLESIDVRTVSIWSRDRTPGRDRQNVGWQLIVKRQKPGGTTWRTFYKTGIFKAPAWNDQSAFFHDSAPRVIAGVMFLDDNSSYKIWSKMIWFRNGAVEGWAVHQHDYYAEQIGTSGNFDLPGTCTGYFQV